MLSALDYLSSENLIHRDVKPDNILYSLSNGGYLFQLADFGLANHRSLATAFCGTGYYQAPELWPFISGIQAAQSPKLDVWSLLVCIVAIRSRLQGFPPDTTDYGVVLRALRAKLPNVANLEPMARLHPDRRASAAQMIVLLFEGKGLTTPKSKIPPIEPDFQAAEPSSRPQTRNDRGKAPKRPLIIYPPKAPGSALARFPLPIWNPAGNLVQPAAAQLRPIHAHMNGVVKHQAKTRVPRAKTRDRISPEQNLPAPIGPPSGQEPPPVPKGPGETLGRIPGAYVD